MPTVEEQAGRRLSGTTAEVTYVIADVADDIAARAALLGEAPSTYQGLALRDDECEVEEIKGLDGYWLGSARYGSGSTSTDTTPSFSFETRGGTQRVTQSLQTVSSYKSASIPAVPGFGGAINVTDSGIEGTDITVPVYTFSETHYFADAAVTPTYKGFLFGLTGRTNSAAFKGLQIGEALFLGAAGTRRGAGDWEISFAFAGSPNITGLSVGDIAGIAKKGWEYLWVRYQTQEDSSAKLLVRKPIAAYVERVYEAGDFSGLAIGTT